MREWAIWGYLVKRIPGREDRQCQGPVAGIWLVCRRTGKESSVAGAEEEG